MRKLFSVFSIALLFSVMGNYSYGQLNLRVSAFAGGVGSPVLYDTWQNAFNDVMSGIHGIAPFIEVMGNMTEGAATPAGGAVLTKNAAFNSVTIQPNPTGVGQPYTVTTPATVTGSIMTFNGVSNSNINGFSSSVPINNIGLKLEYLDLQATRIAGCIQLINGSSNNTIQYVECKTVSLSGRLIYINTSNIHGVGNDNNVVEHCIIDGGLRGYQVFGTNVPTPPYSFNRDNIFRKNTIKNASALAVFIGTATTGNECDQNDIFIDRVINPAVLVNYRGINVQAVGNNYITKNKVHELTLSPSTTAHSFIGIISIPVVPVIPGGPYAAHILMSNNCVTLMENNSLAPFIYGIAPLSTAPPGDNPYSLTCVNNTSRVGGISDPGIVGYTVALAIDIETSGSTVNSFNNICQNERTLGVTPGTFHIGYDISAYPNGVTIDSDDQMNWAKDIAPRGVDAAFDGLLYKGPSLVTGDFGLGDYKFATANSIIPPIEQNTIFKMREFSGLNSCEYSPFVILVGGDMCGKPLALVPDDIHGILRNVNYPYKGCYEGPALKVLSLTLCLEGKVSGGEIKVSLYQACGFITDCTADINFTTGKTDLCFGNAVTDGAGYYLKVNSINHLETWSALPNISFAAGSPPNATYDFTTSPAKAFGGNQTPLPAPSCMFGGDVNQDGTIDVTDLGDIDNDGFNFVGGNRVPTDINSDGTVDVTDASIADNNSYNFISKQSPCPEPTSIISGQTQEVKKLQRLDKRNVINEVRN